MNLFKIISLFILVITLLGCSERKDFNSTEWKNWTESEATLHTRWQMHKDLLKKYKLKGVSRDSILNLLGEPYSQIENEFRYNIGYSGKGIDSATMTITFENDSVIDITVTD